MSIRLLQIQSPGGLRELVFTRNRGAAWRLNGITTTLALARRAIEDRVGLATAVAAHDSGEPVDLDAAFADGRVLPPIDEGDPARLLLTGASEHGSGPGVGPADAQRLPSGALEGGKPAEGEVGVQPGWFYKGDGHGLRGPDAALLKPDFAQGVSAEPEIAGIYVVGADGIPYRLGFALANDLSDPLAGRQSLCWRGHSKLRQAALGAELLTGVLPGDIRGAVRIRRDGVILSEQPFLAGEDNMPHSIANLEYHHFKYDRFRQPGDVHVHFLGTACIPPGEAVVMQEGDIMEIAAEPFRYPLRNRLETAATARRAVVEVL